MWVGTVETLTGNVIPTIEPSDERGTDVEYVFIVTHSRGHYALIVRNQLEYTRPTNL